MDNSLWNSARVKRYLKMYGDPREKRGSQSQLCEDASRLFKSGSALDVACGIGHLVPFCGDREYLGIDNSAAMLDRAARFFPEKTFQKHDATDFDLGRTFYNVVAISLFLHLKRKDARKSLENMWRHTEPGDPDIVGSSGLMIFGMETHGTSQTRRESGLLIRNQSVDEVITDLKEIVGEEANIAWTHQKITYQTISDVTFSLHSPHKIRSHLPIARTTLFKISRKGAA